MDIIFIWLQFAVVTALIFFTSKFLARSVDVIAFKTGLGRAFLGVVLLASATSLPELGTGISSISIVGDPDLAAGDAFGSNLVNLLIIGLMDLWWRNGPILNAFGNSVVMVATLGILVIGAATIALTFHSSTGLFATWFLSPFSILMMATFVIGLYLIYKFEQTERTERKAEDADYSNAKLPVEIGVYLISAAVVIASAVWLAFTGERIADEMGWETSFVGTQFLALSTSLPEIGASFAALRIRAPELAISNVLGSNLFNMGFVLWADDLAYSGGTFWTAISEVHSMTAILAIVMTAVVIIALVKRNRSRPSRFWTYEAVTIIALYALASVLIFYLS